MYRRGSVRVVAVISGLSSLIWLGSSVACGGAGEEEPSSPSTPTPPVSTSSGGSAPTPQQADPPPAAPNEPPNTEGSPEPSNTPIVPDETEPAAVDGSASVDACSALGEGDACGACVCTECRSELDTCLGVQGCAAILACVRESGCSGRECYCGDASLTECVRGEANGPCQEAVLAAPGGKAPSITDPSGGPASDAALDVSDCADEDNTCQDVCSLGD